MTAARFHLSREQIFDNAGKPAAGAKLFFYTTGTLTLLNTYSNAALSTLNNNPVVADSNGRFGDIFLQDQTYRVMLKDTTEATTFFDTDPVYKDVTFIRSAGLPAVSFPNMLVHNTSDGKKYRRNSTGSGWIDEGPIDSVGNTAGVSDVVAGTSTSLFTTPDAVAGLWERGTDIASATTLTIPVAGGGYFEVTGTTTIAGINSQRSGLEVTLRFAGVLTLTNSGTFALIGGANITTAAGDIAVFRNVSTVATSGTSWRMVAFERASGSPLNINDVFTVATQANQETATSLVTLVTPGRQHFHPSAAKYWSAITVSGGTPTTNDSFNHSSTTDNGIGDFTLNFTTAFSSAGYAPAAWNRSAVALAQSCLSADPGDVQTTTALQIQARRGTDAAQDPEALGVVIFGDR